MEMRGIKPHHYAFQNDHIVSRAYENRNRSHSQLVVMLHIPPVYECYTITMRRAGSELVSTYCHYGAPCLYFLPP